jgi:hypothetical protein
VPILTYGRLICAYFDKDRLVHNSFDNGGLNCAYFDNGRLIYAYLTV